VAIRTLDLGPCRATLHEGDLERCAVLLPGMRYGSQAPLLWFARSAARQQGWSALEVVDALPDDEEPFAWARDRAERGLDAVPPPAAAGGGVVAVVGKSLASAAAGVVADRGLPAVWLTPLVREAPVADGLARVRAPALLVGGGADRSWDAGAVPDNAALEVLELPGLDHLLEAPGDVAASLRALGTVTDAVAGFLARPEVSRPRPRP
jgi:hypothetical protein